jgi:hypothetical protein
MLILGWRCGTSDRGPVLQAQSTKFKFESHQKKKKKGLRNLKKNKNLEPQVLAIKIIV